VPSFAAEQLARIQGLLAANIGLKSISVDGVNVSYDDLVKQYDEWSSKVARENGTRPRISQIYMGRFP
jgi:hypothetical protein